MADKIINLKIPSAKVTTALEGFLETYPNNEMIPNPDFVDLETTPEEAETVNKYIDKDWVTEKVRRWVRDSIRRGLNKKAKAAAVVAEDDNIVKLV